MGERRHFDFIFPSPCHFSNYFVEQKYVSLCCDGTEKAQNFPVLFKFRKSKRKKNKTSYVDIKKFLSITKLERYNVIGVSSPK